MPQPKPSAGIFVDVQNVYYTCRQAYQRQFDYRRLWQRLSTEYQIDLANAYAIESHNDGQHKFQTALKSIGFTVKLKPYIQRSDGSAKGDWDVGITIDLMLAAANLEHIFLMSGDGDFDLLVRHVSQQHQVSIHVISVEALTARSLISSCDFYEAITPADLI